MSLHSLEVFEDGRCVFASDGSWLHPLFDLEREIRARSLDPARLAVHDKVVGTASAFLVVSLGIRSLHAGVLSGGGQSVLERFGVAFTFDTRADRIGCATETLLDPSMPPAEAVALLRSRAARGRGNPGEPAG